LDPELASLIQCFAGPSVATMSTRQVLEDIGEPGDTMRSEAFYGD